MIDRRGFLLAAALAAPAWAAAARNSSYRDDAYAGGMIIDAQTTPGGYLSDPAADIPLSPTEISDVKASGLTAISLTIGAIGNGPGKFDATIAQIAAYEREIADHPDVFLKVRRFSDLAAAKASGRVGIIYGFQDTGMLDGVLSRVRLFHELGVRIIQLTYNRRNLMADGCLEPADGGLSKLGRDLIAQMNEMGILVDLSHAGPRTIREGIATSRVPVAITHTGCRALNDVPRNVHDAELKALADRGGVAGIYFMPLLSASGQPHAEDVIRHLEHAVNVCGEDHVGIGTDGAVSAIRIDAAYREFQKNGYEERRKAGIAAPGESAEALFLIPEYNHPRRFKLLADDLAQRGWPSGRIEKILGANFARLFSSVWKA